MDSPAAVAGDGRAHRRIQSLQNGGAGARSLILNFIIRITFFVKKIVIAVIIWDCIDVLFDSLYFYGMENLEGTVLHNQIYRNHHVLNAI